MDDLAAIDRFMPAAVEVAPVAGATPGSYIFRQKVNCVVLHQATGQTAYLRVRVPGTPANAELTGDFSADENWTKGTGWAITDGKAVKSAGEASLLQQAIGAVKDTLCLLTYTVSDRTAGGITPFIGQGYGATQTTNATFIEAIRAGIGDAVGGLTLTAGSLAFYATSTFDGKIDDVSCWLYATHADYGAYDMILATGGKAELTLGRAGIWTDRVGIWLPTGATEENINLVGMQTRRAR